ncbi:MAG: TerC family protein [Acidimicrobiia bacterium]|nr:TerC family protein [Acidimicrobiia bacterium]
MLLGASNSRENFVDIDVSIWAWVILAAIIVVLLAVDLYRHRGDKEPTARLALLESAGWIACGLAFGGAVAIVWGGEAFGEYISGYLIEKSLSIDNVFVWSLVFTTMAIPLRYQHRVLFWGVFGALVLRAGFIAIGSALITRFAWVLIFFGVFLIYTGLKIIRHRDDESTDAATPGLGLLSRIMPVSQEYDGHNFFTRLDGVRAATPLFAALVVIELTDVIFAVDSVPAILAVSNEPFLVFASNAFAILGLRALYFLLADARERFHYLSHGLGAILIFVGIKMVIARWYHVDTFVSLAVILAILVIAIVFSERKARQLGISGRQLSQSHDHD